MILVSRFRSSHHCAAHSFANFGIKGTLAIYDSSAVFGFEVPTQTRGYNDRNFKSTALVWLCILRSYEGLAANTDRNVKCATLACEAQRRVQQHRGAGLQMLGPGTFAHGVRPPARGPPRA